MLRGAFSTQGGVLTRPDRFGRGCKPRLAKQGRYRTKERVRLPANVTRVYMAIRGATQGLFRHLIIV